MKQIYSALEYYPIYILILLLLLGYFIIVSSLNYIDIFTFCSISIDKDFLHGNRDTIKKALSYLKKTDPLGYRLICTNVEKIGEDYCPIDHEYGGAWTMIDEPSCFVKSTRIIYLKPDKDASDDTVILRAEAIKHTANLLKQYWQKK